MQGDCLTVAKAAEVLGYSPQTIRKLCRSRPGFGYRLTPQGQWRVHAQSVIDLMHNEGEAQNG